VPFGVSVGHGRDGRPLVGAIALPASRALAWAVRGRGAFLRRAGRIRPLRVSTKASLDQALVLTGYGYARAGYPTWLRRFERALSAAQAVRMTGAAVADLVALADGVADVVWEDEYQPWDYAAGALLVEEAGGRVTTVEGAELAGTPSSFLGTNGRLHEAMLRFLAG
jgi:myo-inositol-1(or 4)-monophosphatase